MGRWWRRSTVGGGLSTSLKQRSKIKSLSGGGGGGTCQNSFGGEGEEKRNLLTALSSRGKFSSLSCWLSCWEVDKEESICTLGGTEPCTPNAVADAIFPHAPHARKAIQSTCSHSLCRTDEIEKLLHESHLDVVRQEVPAVTGGRLYHRLGQVECVLSARAECTISAVIRQGMGR